MTESGIHAEFSGAIAVLKLASPKANSMSPQMLGELAAAVDQIARSAASAVVVTGTGRTFSAGLALPLIADYERDDLRAFMTGFSRTMEAVLCLDRPVIAAINGHAIAGGCVLALMCDYRVMADQGKIGLNEAQLGIGLPPIVTEPLRTKLTGAAAARVALSGELFSPNEALGLGLVDRVVPANTVMEVSAAVAQQWAGRPEAAAQIKSALLRPMVAALRAADPDALEPWLDTWFSPTGRRAVTAAVAALGRG